MKIVLAMGSHHGYCDLIKNQQYPYRLVSFHYQKGFAKEQIIERFCTNQKHSDECPNSVETGAK